MNEAIRYGTTEHNGFHEAIRARIGGEFSMVFFRQDRIRVGISVGWCFIYYECWPSSYADSEGMIAAIEQEIRRQCEVSRLYKLGAEIESRKWEAA